MKLSLVATTDVHKKVKEYLEQNVSNELADKINNGVQIEKDGKKLLNKKTLDGFMKYATEEARKTVKQGATSACIEDSVVFGWAIHYFEEESIEEKLYNEDGTEYAKPKPEAKSKKPKKTITPQKEEKKEETPKVTPTQNPPAPTTEPQMSFFDLM